MRRLVAHQAAAERLAQALVAETHAEDGHLARQLPNRLRRDTRVRWRPRPWGDDDPIKRPKLRNRDLVVAEHARLSTELGQVLHQVVRERVVVVDDGEVHHICSAISMALNMAPAFSSVSSNSRSGRESATTPAPACTYAVPSATTTVRSVMAMSRLP